MVKRLLNSCGPEGSRTPNLLIRSQVLYPIKLQVQYFKELPFNFVAFERDCKDRSSFQNSNKILNLTHKAYNRLIITPVYLFRDLAWQ